MISMSAGEMLRALSGARGVARSTPQSVRLPKPRPINVTAQTISAKPILSMTMCAHCAGGAALAEVLAERCTRAASG